jgi:threonine dehydratase
MATGIALAAATRGVRVYAVEPVGKRLADAFAAGERLIDPRTADAALHTIADAIRSQPLGPTPWSLRHLLQPAVLSVTDDQIRSAMRHTAQHIGQVVEPAGAVATAALLSPAFREEQRRAAAAGRPIRRVGVIVCGGNIELAEWARLVGLGS